MLKGRGKREAKTSRAERKKQNKTKQNKTKQNKTKAKQGKEPDGRKHNQILIATKNSRDIEEYEFENAEEKQD